MEEMFAYNLDSLDQAIAFLSANKNPNFGFALHVLERKRDELQANMAAEKELEVEPKVQKKVKKGKETLWIPDRVAAYNHAQNALPPIQRAPKSIWKMMKQNDPSLTLTLDQVRNYVHYTHKKIRQLLGSNSVQTPDATHRIYKHECCISFDTPRSEGGLFVDMNSFVAFGKEHVIWNFEKTGNRIYLHIKQTTKSVPKDRPLKKPMKKRTPLAIGGFDNNEPEYEYSIVTLPDFLSLPFLPSVDIPEKVRTAVDAVVNAVGADQVAAWTAEEFDRSRIQESGKELEPVSGPRFTGLVNLGNSCYLAAMMQILFSTRSFISRYFSDQTLKVAFHNAPADPTLDLNMQLTKLGHGLLSGKYSIPATKNDAGTGDAIQGGIPPRMFKNVIALNHAEFSSMEQQDALEFFLHLLNKVQGVCNTTPDLDPSRSFKFGVEEKTICSSSGKVAYNKKVDCILSLHIPLHEATNKDELEAFNKHSAGKGLEENDNRSSDEIVRPRVPLEACLAHYASPEQIHDYYSSALKGKTTATKTTGLTSFPDYLVLHMQKYSMEAGVPKKLDVSIDVPDVIDISHMRSKGLQPGEELLPDGEEVMKSAQPVANEGIVAQLVSMGRNQLHCQKAAINTSNAGVEEAEKWLLSHMDDPDIDAPISHQTPDVARKALTQTPAESGLPDGGGRYKLFGIIDHVGTSVHCGHYVAHILKEGRWVIFNDSKVSISTDPPKDIGYLHFFQRLDG